mgnify:CR=1 FL=1|tara:strand:+ start:5442 stop:6206 length:765 start_codon:yes stop_codon:yes gene_type:complete
MVKIGIIGGTGLENMEIIENSSDISIKTPYGNPSSALKEGSINGENIVVLNRHGKSHTISPTNVNYRANIWALKEIGCTHILATTAVGSLRQEIKPGDIVFPNQFIDHSKKRDLTFFDKEEVVHTPMAEPFCPWILEALQSTSKELDITYHTNKTVITIEGPRFSTKLESQMFRLWKADIINMSTCPEVTLAREQKIHYAAIALSTDYDSWKEDQEPVSYELIQKTLKKSSSKVTKILLKTLAKIHKWEDVCLN